MTDHDGEWERFKASRYALLAMPGMDVYNFLRRIDFATKLGLGNAQDLMNLVVTLTTPETARTVFRYGARESTDGAFVTLSRVLHNFLSGISALVNVTNSHAASREKRDARWAEVRTLTRAFLARPVIAILIALRNHAVHVNTINTGYRRQFTNETDRWYLEMAKSQFNFRNLSKVGMTYWQQLPDNLNVTELVNPAIPAIADLYGAVVALVNRAFRSELDALLAVDRDLRDQYPRFYGDVAEGSDPPSVPPLSRG